MGSWGPEDERRVSPTARWFMRGAWKILLVIFVILLIGAITELLD